MVILKLHPGAAQLAVSLEASRLGVELLEARVLELGAQPLEEWIVVPARGELAVGERSRRLPRGGMVARRFIRSTAEVEVAEHVRGNSTTKSQGVPYILFNLTPEEPQQGPVDLPTAVDILSHEIHGPEFMKRVRIRENKIDRDSWEMQTAGIDTADAWELYSRFAHDHLVSFDRKQMPINYAVSLSDKPGYRFRLLFPYRHLAQIFLDRVKGNRTMPSKAIGPVTPRFERSSQLGSPHMLHKLRREPYRDPFRLAAREARIQLMSAVKIPFASADFGFLDHDGVFSLEFECFSDGLVRCDGPRRRILLCHPNERVQMEVRDDSVAALHLEQGQNSCFVFLHYAPIFKRHADGTWQRLPGLPGVPELGCSFLSSRFRLSFSTPAALQAFVDLARQLSMPSPSTMLRSERRGLFAADYMNELGAVAPTLPIPVGFQLSALVFNRAVSLRDAVALLPLVQDADPARAADTLQTLRSDFANGWKPRDDIVAQYRRAGAKAAARSQPADEGKVAFRCHSVLVTPTTLWLEGPHLNAVSNRVLRHFAEHLDCFLKVTFLEEDRLPIRHAPELDMGAFYQSIVGHYIRHGILIAGQLFEFLGYSHSSLRSHQFWFCKPFVSDGERFDAVRIRRGLGDFSRLSSFPARFAARVAQAFTATEKTVTLERDQIVSIPDITVDQRDFTDGAGTVSLELATLIWERLLQHRRWTRAPLMPEAFQIRLGGAKGVISVDRRLEGVRLCLRPSMVKFESPDFLDVEVANFYPRPGPFFLNRPLIQILECLGVADEAIIDLLDAAIDELRADKPRDLRAHALTLQDYGLGHEFGIPALLFGMHRRGITSLNMLKGELSIFLKTLLRLARTAMTRELKHRAHIKVPNSHTLLGVADESAFLGEGQVYCAIRDDDGNVRALQGTVMVVRSPVVHPGDVRVLEAFGEAPAGVRPPVNVLVFSIKGPRPLPGMMGNGDLDGDLFGIVAEPSIIPPRTVDPAQYPLNKPHDLGRPATLDDLADFICSFMQNDYLGVVANRLMTIADVSNMAIFDPKCLHLAALHSRAVDFTKSGHPVLINQIPHAKTMAKPHFMATVDYSDTAPTDSGLPSGDSQSRYELYRSKRLLGLLYDNERLQVADLAPPADLTGPPIPRTFDPSKPPTRAKDKLADKLADELLKRGITPRDADADQFGTLYSLYVDELERICRMNTVSHRVGSMLSEAEVALGYLVSVTPQYGRRKAVQDSMRQQATELFRVVQDALRRPSPASDAVEDVIDEGEAEGDIQGTLAPSSPNDDGRAWIERAWLAWNFATSLPKKEFGARSFQMVVLAGLLHSLDAA